MIIARDSVAIVPVIRDGAQAGQPLASLELSGAGQIFTEMFDVGRYVELIGFIYVTAHSGTNPTLDIRFQFSHDGKHFTDSGDAFTQVTTTDSLTFKRVTANFGKYMRLGIVLGGTTPDYTLSVTIMAKN